MRSIWSANLQVAARQGRLAQRRASCSTRRCRTSCRCARATATASWRCCRGRRGWRPPRPARDSAAGVGSGRRARDVRAAEGGGGAGRPAGRRLDRSQPGLRRPPPPGARVLGVRVAARGGRPRARPRRPPVRRPLPVGAIARRHRREESADRHRPRADLRRRAQEVAVGRPVWESRRLLDGFASESPLDAFVRDRAGESLAHVFTLLSLVLPREPLQIAFRSLHTDDEHLQGTALEYLEGVLPAPIRQRLWPFLERRAGPPSGAPARGSHRRPAALEPFDPAEPRGAEAAARHLGVNRRRCVGDL